MNQFLLDPDTVSFVRFYNGVRFYKGGVLQSELQTRWSPLTLNRLNEFW